MNQSISVPVAKKKKRTQFVFQLIMMVGVLGFIWFSFGRNVLAPISRGEAPEKLGGMELVSKVEGEEAIAQVSRLHGTNINLLSAYIATYTHQAEKVTVWSSKAESPREAANLLARMVAGINKGNSPFTNLRSVTIDGQEVYQVSGPGGQHFFYIPGKTNRVVWLSIISSDAMKIMNQAVKIF